MRAFHVTAPGTGRVDDVDPPVPAAGQAVIDVTLVGICGTDSFLFEASADELAFMDAGYPLRLGHEWTGTVSSVGADVDASWLGQRVVGDAILGCGNCVLCHTGRHNVCESRYEVGVRGGWPGALAEKLLMPVSVLRRLPGGVSDVAGAMVEPGANSFRAVEAGGAGPGEGVLILGPGTIGLLCAAFAFARGCEVHVLGRSKRSLDLARRFGVEGAWTRDDLPARRWDVVIDATDAPEMPGLALDLVEPGGCVVFVGIAHAPSTVDSRMFAFKDLRAAGVLGGSQGLDATIAAYADGVVDPAPLVRATIGLSDAASALAGHLPDIPDVGSKILVDPRQ